MKIGIAQTKSLKGGVRKNIQNHVRVIEDAIALNADLIIFPELSITSYEPSLAKQLARNIEDVVFDPFQLLSDENDISIGIGMPTSTAEGTQISMLIFQAYKPRVVYSKQILHSDEKPYFISGKEQVYLEIKGKKIALGICYETLQREHFLNANRKGAEIYIASVAKPEGGVEKAYSHFPNIANEFSTAILMSNSVGYCDNFISDGQSAVWNKAGELIWQLDNSNEGLLIYDTELDTAELSQLHIEKGKLSNLDKVFKIYQKGKVELERKGLFQWTDKYPSVSIIEKDLRKGILYILKQGKEIIGAINISEEQEEEYQTVNWKYDDAGVLVIHRLVVNPNHQRQGHATRLMDFAEKFAIDNDYSSIRLDAYSQNRGVIDFYTKRNYHIRGDVNFPKREYSFHCMEKEII